MAIIRRGIWSARPNDSFREVEDLCTTRPEDLEIGWETGMLLLLWPWIIQSWMDGLKEDLVAMPEVLMDVNLVDCPLDL